MSAWKVSLGSAAVSQPVLGGDVFIGATASSLRGIDLYTGKDRWAPYTLSTNGIESFAISSNRAFFLGNPVDFGGVSDADSTSPGGQTAGSEFGGLPGGAGGTAGSDVGGLPGGAGGTEDPTSPGGQTVDSGSGALTGSAGTAAGSIGLVALDLGTGKYCEEWAGVGNASGKLLDPLVEANVLVLRDEAGLLTGYDASPGNEPLQLWQVDTSEAVQQGSSFTPGPAALGDRAAFFVIGGEFVGVNVQSGQTRWKFPDIGKTLLPGQAANAFQLEPGDSLPQVLAPIAGNGLVVIIGQNNVYGLDWTTGARVWTIPLEGDSVNRPAVSLRADTLFFTTKSGRAFGGVLSTGEEFWSSDLTALASDAGVTGQSGGFLSPIIDTGVMEPDVEKTQSTSTQRVFLPAESGAVFVLDVTMPNRTADLAVAQDYKVTVSPAIESETGLAYAPAIGNGMLLMTDQSGGVQAKAFTSATAAYIGDNAHISLSPKPEYDFGTGEFSLEAWVRTSVGGDLITQSPYNGGNGFRLTVANQPQGMIAQQYGEGRVRFTICDSNGNVVLFAQTLPTLVADGEWHHVAVARRGNQITMFVDGISQPVDELIYRSLVAPGEQSLLPPASLRNYFSPDVVSENTIVPPLPNSGEPIVVGAYLPSSANFQDAASVHYEGLVADVRIWNTAVTAEQVIDRMYKLLTGHEPGLAGYWPLNQKPPTDFQDSTDDVALGAAQVPNVECLTTNLKLSNDLFPYLLHGVKDAWPYKERWTVRAEDAPKWSPAGAGEVLCFATDLALYAVDMVHGTRKWGYHVSRSSPPAASYLGCFILDDTTLKSFDTESGVVQWFKDLTQQAPASGPRSVDLAPMLTSGCVVCSADGENFYWIGNRTGKVLGHYAAPAAVEGELLASGNRLYLIAGGEVHLFEDPPASTAAAETMTPVASAPISTSGTPRMCADGGRLFVYDGARVAALDSQTLQSPNALPAAQKFAWNPASTAGQTVSGMAASANFNTLVLTTANGTILFWDFGSGKQRSSYSISGLADPQVFAPVIQGKNVYCTAAATTGANRNGGIWAFDLSTGDLRAIDEVGAPPVGSPYVLVDTAFFCVDNQGAPYATSMQLDGEAVHSAVFGSTLVLFREAGDPAITVANVDSVFAGAQAEETGSSEEASNAFEDGDFTLDAWVNSQHAQGGEVISVPPGTVSGNPIAGFSLSMDDQGVITAEHLKTGAGSAFASQPTEVVDGRWHHVAAVFRYNQEQKQQLCYIYLDGKELTGVTYETMAVPAPVTDRVVTLGGSDASDFEGLLDEVRVWGTWLHAAEISRNRNVKLRGNEADLLACWSFDATGVKDASTNALNQFNATGAPDLKIWLTDLNFVAPSYPYLLAKSKGVEVLTQTAPDGHGQTITSAKYQTTVSARQADGSPRPQTTIKVWASEKTVITSGQQAAVTVTEDKPAEFTLGLDGQLKLQLSTSDVSHSPVLWINADFMYENERFFVAPAVENQQHVVIPPPHLAAQSTMIQDYAYTTGDKLGKNKGKPGVYTLNKNVDITTIHTIITSMTASGEALPNQSLELWAGDHLTIEVDNQTYEINTENSVGFKTGPDGTLTVVLRKDANPQGSLLDCPTLNARAGFMPRNSRFVIAPSENANKTLSTVNGGQIYGTQEIAPGEQKKTLITQLKKTNATAAKQQAPAIAATINQMASLARKHAPATGNVAGTAAAASGPPTGAETLNAALLPPDTIESVPNSAHLPFHAPITPEYMPAKHLVLSLNADGSWTHSCFDATAALNENIATLGLPGIKTSDQLFSSASLSTDDDAAGGWFDSWGHDIKRAADDVEHGVEDAYQAAKHVIVKTYDEVKRGVDALGHDIVTVVHRVEVAVVDATKAIGKWVIKTVKDAVTHIVAFLKKVMVVLKDVYDFLKSLFDWDAILQVHDVLRTTFNNNLAGLEYEVKNTIPNEIDQGFAGVKAQLAASLGVAESGGPVQGSIASQKSRVSGQAGTCISHSKSSKSRWMQGKLKAHATSMHSTPPAPYPESGTLAAPFSGSLFTSGSGGDLNQDFAKLVDEFKTVLNQPGGITHLTMKELLTILDDVLNIVIDLAEDLLTALLDLVAFAIEQILELSNKELDIPFISALYELITGDSLTILDVLCLIAAIPVHIAAVVLNVDFEENDAQAFLDGHQAFSKAAAAGDAAGAGTSTSLKFVDVTYLVCTILQGIFSGMSNVLQGQTNLADPEEGGTGGEAPQQPLVNMIFSTFAGFASCATGSFQWAVRRAETNTWKPGSALKTILTYMTLIGPLISFATGCASIAKRRSGNTSETYGKLKKDPLGIGGTPMPLVLSCLGFCSLGIATYTIIGNKGGPSEELAEDGINFLTGFNGLCSFLSWSYVCRETDVEGVVLSTIGLALINVGVLSVANPVIHRFDGYGKEIFG